MNDQREKPTAWCFVTADQEVIQGNREGLQTLRAAIDRALESGEGRIETTSDDLTIVQRLEADPRLEPRESTMKWRNRLGCFVGVVVSLGVLALAALGVVFLWQQTHR